MYEKLSFTLTDSQKKKLAHAYTNKIPISLRLSKSLQSPNGVPLLLTKGEVKKLNAGGNHDITISVNRLKELHKEGGFIQAVLPWIPTILGALASTTGIASNIKSMVNGKGLRLKQGGKGLRLKQGQGVISDLNIPIISNIARVLGLGYKPKRAKGLRLAAKS